MSSTGLIDVNANYINSDIIDVNEKLTVNNIDIIDLINNNFNDLSGNIQDLSENVINKINDLSLNLINKITDLSQNLYDLDNTVIDLSENLYDLSENVADVKSKNDAQALTIFGHGAQISANSNAIGAAATVLGTTVTATGANTAAIATIVLQLGIPSVAGVTPSTGLYAAIDSKTSRSLFGSGNVAIYGLGPLEYINLVYNNDHFEDIKLISNHELNLKEPYKSLPSVVDTINNNKQDKLTFITPLNKDVSNNISIDLSGYVLNTKFDLSFNDISNNKQDKLIFTTPLQKDISNNVSIDLSSYVLNTKFDLSFNDISNNKQDKLIFSTPLKKDISNNVSIDLSGYAIGNIKGIKATLNEGYLDPSGNSLIFYHNNPGTYFTDNGFNSYFNLSSATITNNNNLAIVPFITNYNRMFKNGINNAIKIASTGSSNSNINSSTYILLDSGSNPAPGTNEGTIKFNIATQSQGAIDRFVITPYSSIFYNNLGIGKSPNYHLDISGNTNSNTIYENNVSLINKYATIFNVTSPLSKDASNNILIDLSAYPLKINVDTSLNHLQNTKEDLINVSTPLIKNGSNITIDLSAYALKNSLNASNVTAGTLPVSFGGIGTTTLNNNQLLIGNGTNAISQSPNLIWNSASNGLGIGVTQLFNSATNFQVNDRRLWVNSSPTYSISVLSTDKYGTGTSETYLQLMENIGLDCRTHLDGEFQFRCATQQAMTVNKDGVSVKNLSVVGEIYSSKLYSTNSTTKSLIKFQTKLGQNGLYYYNIDLNKYYKTGQTINSNEYKIFNLTSWAEDAFSIINKCTVYISSQSPGIKYIMFYDNWGVYLSNGNQSGWQRDTSTRYMTFVSATQKNIITILENLF